MSQKIGQSGGASRWRVCYQRGLPRLVFDKIEVFPRPDTLCYTVELAHCNVPYFYIYNFPPPPARSCEVVDPVLLGGNCRLCSALLSPTHFERMFTPHHVSHVRCHVSCVRCQI